MPASLFSAEHNTVTYMLLETCTPELAWFMCLTFQSNMDYKRRRSGGVRNNFHHLSYINVH